MEHLEIIELYFETIIKPLQKEIKILRLKNDKNKFSLTKNIENEYLQKWKIYSLNIIII